MSRADAAKFPKRSIEGTMEVVPIKNAARVSLRLANQGGAMAAAAQTQ